MNLASVNKAKSIGDRIQNIFFTFSALAISYALLGYFYYQYNQMDYQANNKKHGEFFKPKQNESIEHFKHTLLVVLIAVTFLLLGARLICIALLTS